MSVLIQIVSGAAVSWPAVFLGYWLSRKKTAEHIDRATADQTRELTEGLADVTSAQTRALKKAIGVDSGPEPPEPAQADPDRFA